MICQTGPAGSVMIGKRMSRHEEKLAKKKAQKLVSPLDTTSWIEEGPTGQLMYTCERSFVPIL